MKKVLILLLLCFSYALQAQDTLEHWSDTYYYKPLKVEIPSLQYKLVNQLVWDKKAIQYRDSEVVTTCLAQSYRGDFFDIAKKVKLDNKTNAYLLHVKSQDALLAYINVTMMIHDSTSIFVYDTSGNQLMKRGSKFNFDKSTSYRGMTLLGSFGIEQNEIIIMFVEPKRYKNKSDIQIKRILWGHHVHYNPFDSERNIKEGLYDDCKNFIQCHQEDWIHQYKSVVQLSYVYQDAAGIANNMNFSGVLLNTSDNYNNDASKEPYLMTCLHAADSAIKYGKTLKDLFEWTDNTDMKNIRIRFMFARDNCKVNDVDPQFHFDIKFKILEKGKWPSTKSAEEDYLFLRFDGKTIESIRKHDEVVFAGWRNDLTDSYSYSKTSPHFSLHHGIVTDRNIPVPQTLGEMRYAIDHDYAYPNVAGSLVHLVYEEGSFNKGGSGSPIFQKHHVIGLNVTGSNDLCDSGIQPTSGGPAFSYLYTKANLKAYLGDAEKAYSWPWVNYGAGHHCTNCGLDLILGEENFNCGGPCGPCGYHHTDEPVFYTRLPQKPLNITSSSKVTIGNPGSMNYVVDQNLNVTTKGEVYIQKNTEFKAGVELNLNAGAIPVVIERPKTGFDGCIEIPKYLSMGKMFKILFKDIERFHIEIWAGNSSKSERISSNYGDVLFDGVTDVWDSQTVTYQKWWNYTLFYKLHFRDTKGVTHYLQGPFGYGGLD